MVYTIYIYIVDYRQTKTHKLILQHCKLINRCVHMLDCWGLLNPAIKYVVYIQVIIARR